MNFSAAAIKLCPDSVIITTGCLAVSNMLFKSNPTANAAIEFTVSVFSLIFC